MRMKIYRKNKTAEHCSAGTIVHLDKKGPITSFLLRLQVGVLALSNF